MSVTKSDICKAVLFGQLCVEKLAEEYIDAVNYGYTDEVDSKAHAFNQVFDVIEILKDYVPEPKIKTGSIVLSDKGRFSLTSDKKAVTLDGQYLVVNPDSVNCLSEKDICDLINKLFTICPNC